MQGELQFGVAQSDWQYHAYNGTKPDKVKPFDGLRAVFSAHPEPFQIIARKGSKIKNWNSLKGKKVNIGNPVLRTKRNFRSSYGVTWCRYRLLWCYF